nr:brain acid soluble protein 1 homolog [Crassostrea gigas]
MEVEKKPPPKKEEKTPLKAKSEEAKKKEKVLKETKNVTKVEKDKKNVSVLSKEQKKEVIQKKEKPKPKAKVPAKTESKPTSAKSETEKTPKDNKYSHITSRLTQETSASLARKTVKRTELLQGNSKVPSPEKADIAKRSQSATRQARSPRKPKELSTVEDNKDLISRSKSTPRPGAHRRQTPSPMRGQMTTTRNPRPTKLLQPKKGLYFVSLWPD